MKRRYSPAARKAHLRAMHNKPVVQQTDPIQKLVESYQQGFITAVELADLILEASDPERCRNCGGRPVFKDGLCKDCYFEWRSEPESAHADDCQCHLCWAASLAPPSPPWEGGAA